MVRLLPPVSVPRFLTACFLEILCGSRASLIRLAAVFEDAMNAVFGVDRGSSNPMSPAMICFAAPAMLITTSVALPLDWMLISSTMFLMRTIGHLRCVAQRSGATSILAPVVARLHPGRIVPETGIGLLCAPSMVMMRGWV